MIFLSDDLNIVRKGLNMHADPEDRPIYETPIYRETRSGIWWVTVLMLGVLLGNVLSYGAYRVYIRWETEQAFKAFEAMNVQLRAQRAAESRERAAQAREQRIATEKRRAVDQQLWATCQFWREQVRQDNSSKNRTYRDAACAKVR